MPTPEEIKKIAREYAKEILSKQPMAAHSIPEIWEKAVADTEKPLAELFEPLIAYLSRDYCIVPKSKVKEMYEKSKTMIRSNSIIDQDCGIVRNSLMDYLFGKSLFEDEQK